MRLRRTGVAWVIALALTPCAGRGGEANLAVAANFAAPAKQLADRFSRASGHRIAVSAGSTGKFYAQISSGAPFDALLSADAGTPQRLELEKLAVAGSRFTYAVGTLVLWSPRPGLVDDQGAVLRNGTFQRLAMANPKLAPYGAAAQQAMEKLQIWERLRERIVQGENIAQTFQFVASGNAELGFIALSQLHETGKPPRGSHWLVPATLHDPIRQDAVLLAHGVHNAAARAFLQFLREEPARAVIRAYGYELP